jgi:hypothetical protein
MGWNDVVQGDMQSDRRGHDRTLQGKTGLP